MDHSVRRKIPMSFNLKSALSKSALAALALTAAVATAQAQQATDPAQDTQVKRQIQVVGATPPQTEAPQAQAPAPVDPAAPAGNQAQAQPSAPAPQATPAPQFATPVPPREPGYGRYAQGYGYGSYGYAPRYRNHCR
jgi:hypothetical protein